jgi:hypothetical protein
MIRECYKLIQEIAIAQDPFCIYPRCSNRSTVGHHLFSRARMATAFHPECVKGLCNTDHRNAHDHPAAFQFFMENIMGERYFELMRLSNTVVKNIDFKEIRDELKKKLTELKK